METESDTSFPDPERFEAARMMGHRLLNDPEFRESLARRADGQPAPLIIAMLDEPLRALHERIKEEGTPANIFIPLGRDGHLSLSLTEPSNSSDEEIRLPLTDPVRHLVAELLRLERAEAFTLHFEELEPNHAGDLQLTLA